MAVPEVVVEGVVFPPVARPPGSAGSHFLGGAGALRFLSISVPVCLESLFISSRRIVDYLLLEFGVREKYYFNL